VRGRSLRGADAIVRTLEALGVTKVFSLSGNHIMTLFDAFTSSRIEVVHSRHEAACVHMADAWGRLTGEVGVALVTAGQGHSNAVAALFTAMAAESPMLLLSGHASLRELGLGAFQELAQVDLAKPVTKASWMADKSSRLADDIIRAFHIAAMGRPGPVHISLPADLLDEELDTGVPGFQFQFARQHQRRGLLEPDLERIRTVVAKAAHPLALCGPAMCSVQRRKALREFEKITKIPAIAMESPRGVKDPALGCFSEVLTQADLLLLVGKQLDFTLGFGNMPVVAQDCAFIAIDPDQGVIDRIARSKSDRLALAVLADSAPSMVDLAQGLRDAGPAAWLEKVCDALSFRPPEWDGLKGTGERAHPVELCQAVGAFLGQHSDSVLVCDGGEFGQWPQAVTQAGSRLINGVSGTIGPSIPFAIAAKAARPDVPVVAMVGDGAFGFHMAEFDTAVRHGFPIIVVVGNDSRWNAEYQIQLRRFGAARARYCDLLPTRYDQLVLALGGFGVLARSKNEVIAGLEQAQASGKPSCINVMIESVPAPHVRRTGPAKELKP
jgi:thiamine pyrophosphate-dependent acetolactate synthase large subunit-like protein